MLDNTAFIETLTDTSATACPACGIAFIPSRKNQGYCSRSCQKNDRRGFRHIENFARDEHEAARARDLRDMLYGAPPSERLDIMKDILDAAYRDSGLRNILTRPELLSDKPFSAGRGQMNIAQAADAHCKRLLRMSVRTYVKHARKGDALDVHIEPVLDRQDHDPVPKLTTKLTSKNVKCIHRPLPDGDDGKIRDALEMADRVAEEVQARINARDTASIPETGLMPISSDEVQVDENGTKLKAGNNKQEAKRKIALSRYCFDNGVRIDSHTGRTVASSMGVRSL